MSNYTSLSNDDTIVHLFIYVLIPLAVLVSAVNKGSLMDEFAWIRSLLTHWGRYKMATISQTTILNAFSRIKMLGLRLLKFVSKGRINNIPSLVQIMAWRRPGDKPLSEHMMVRLPTHTCVARPQWVNFISSHWWQLLCANLKCILRNNICPGYRYSIW